MRNRKHPGDDEPIRDAGEEQDTNLETAPEPAASKTSLKKAMLALQALGTELVSLSQDALGRLDLPDALLAAVLDAKRFRQHGAHRRQLQYIGRLMRDLDTEHIAEQLARLRGESATAKAEFHALERWRSHLLEDDQALVLWLDRHPESDVQQLRQLIRNARREQAEGKPPKASRQLFRLLRETESEQREEERTDPDYRSE
ncbi:MAG TPA: ribosome biogenesis factor YjgA [Thiobacillaceae bacterium]|nr:ribosome biogenesis factor YjgA [Thiobacillaceae bacterium]